MSICWWVRVRWSMKSRASVTDLRQNSSMFSPPTVTARDSFLSRRPPQSGQGDSLMHSSSSRRTESDWVSR